MPDHIADQLAIIDVAVAYTWALDTKQVEDLRSVFLPDATATLRGVECVGVDAIIARIGGSILRLDRTQHLVGNHQVHVDGDTATHRCHLQSQHVLEGTEGGDNFIVGGFYDDRLVRTAAGWRIAHRVMQQTWTEGNRLVVTRP
jgi:SnoaL-like domain